MSRIAIVATCLAISCIWLAASAGAESSAWNFNAIHGVPHELMIAVGNKGNIVHFVFGEPPTKMPSGTERNLLDVYVASPNLAVAVGDGIVIVWDGSSWSSVAGADSALSYDQTWVSPVPGLILFGGVATGGYRLCPWRQGANHQAFCRYFSAPLRTACGRDDEIILVFADGTIYRVNDALMGPYGSYEPAFRPHELLHLKSAWISNKTCGTLNTLPNAIGVSTDGPLVHFDGMGWQVLEGSASIKDRT